MLTKVEGVGNVTATYIARHYGTLEDFIKANFLSLGSITNSKGKPAIRRALLPGILEAIKTIPKGHSVKETWIRVLVKEFLDKQVDMLKGLSLSTLMINPFLVRALELKTPSEVIKFNLYQNVTRSIVTSWGFCVQEILIRSGGENIPEKNTGFDIRCLTTHLWISLIGRSRHNS